MVTPYPNKCNSTQTSGTKNIYPYPYVDVDERGSPLKSGVTVGIDAASLASRARGANLPRFWVGTCPVEPKSVPITWAKFFIKKTPKTYKNDKNLLISLDLFKLQPLQKFQSLLSSRAKYSIFFIFTYNRGKISLILPSTRGAQVYLVSTGSCPPVTSSHINWALNTSLFTARTWEHFLPLLNKVFPLRVTKTVNCCYQDFFLFALYLIELS